MNLIRTVIAATAGLTASLLVLATPAQADNAEQHCMVGIVDVNKGVIETGPATCFATEAEALDDAAGDDSSRSANGPVGAHYSGTGFTGSSITITGSSCNGGVWRPSGSWDNNIESSRHHCPGDTTTFYDSSNCSTGSYAITTDRPTLNSMNNRASCVRYG